MKYVKSPLNYVGGKFRLLPQLLPLFPRNIGTFYDIFAGGANVAVNVDARRTVINDKQEEVVNLLLVIHQGNPLSEFDDIIAEFELTADNDAGYYALRDYYNNVAPTSALLYMLIAHSFNNQIRFNKRGEFNMPFGARTFNKQLRQRFVEFSDAFRRKKVSFSRRDFRAFYNAHYYSDDFVYCDPPYLITTASYNEQGGWTAQDDADLMNMLDRLDADGVRWAMSNVLTHKGRTNKALVDWSTQYNVHELSASYANASYQSSKRDAVTREVLITNYKAVS